MIRGMATFILLGAVFLVETLELPEEIPLIEAELGDNVTLRCFSQDFDQALVYWYKYQYGFMIHTIQRGSFGEFKEIFDNSRVNVKIKDDKNIILTIANISKDDEATYFCQAGSSYNMKFVNGTHLVVKNPKNKPISGFVKQSSKLELVLLGNTVNLECSVQSKKNQCAGEHRVYWYKAGSTTRTDILHTTSFSCDDPEGRCVYSLAKTIRTFSDSGVYFCAVESCGEILFGDGTRVKIHVQCPHMSIFGTLLACSVLLNIALFLARLKQKGILKFCKGDAASCSQTEQLRSAETQSNYRDLEGTEMCYAALEFMPGHPRRSKINEHSAEDYIYSQTVFKRRVHEE